MKQYITLSKKQIDQAFDALYESDYYKGSTLDYDDIKIHIKRSYGGEPVLTIEREIEDVAE